MECIANGSLGALNPVPWAIMTGNCFGWVVYAYMKQDPYLLASNLPGFLISLWLNVGAAKLQYLEQTKSSDDNSSTLLGPQERLFSKVILIWSGIIIWVGFIMSSTVYSPAEVVGILVNLNLIFYYAAPLQLFVRVVRTKSSSSIHVPSVLMNIVNTSFWIAYGIAKKDLIIIIPNGLGFLLSAAQGMVCLVYPRTTGENDEEDVEACHDKSSLLKRYQTQTTSRMSSLTS
jgi:solute carrier family 50 protein (sugar transporter)